MTENKSNSLGEKEMRGCLTRKLQGDSSRQRDSGVGPGLSLYLSVPAFLCICFFLCTQWPPAVEPAFSLRLGSWPSENHGFTWELTSLTASWEKKGKSSSVIDPPGSYALLQSNHWGLEGGGVMIGPVWLFAPFPDLSLWPRRQKMAAPVGPHGWRQGVGQFPQRMGVLSPEERQLFFLYICKDLQW